MSETNLFVQVEGQQEIRELAIPENATIDDLRDAVTASGITIGPIQEKWRRPTLFALLLPRI